MTPGTEPVTPARPRQHVVHVGFHAAEAHTVDFEADHVTAVLARASAARLPAELAARFARIVVVDLPDSDDLDTYDRAFDDIRALVEELAAEFGPPAAIIGIYEHTTLPAARLREHFGLPGTGVLSAMLCRDKVPMKTAVAAAGVPVPRFLAVGPDTDPDVLAAFARLVPGRVVLKPRSQAAARGIHTLPDGAALLALAAGSGLPADYEAEEFVEGSIYHIDGVVRDGTMRWFCACRYVGTCLDFQHGDTSLAAVTEDDPELAARIRSFTTTVVQILQLHDSVIHLELFHTPDDELVFLEISNRFGGAGIGWHQRDVLGVDLAREAVLACLGRPSEVPVPRTMLDHPDPPSSGWLYLPLTIRESRVVGAVTALDDLPGSVLHSWVPSVGDVLEPSGSIWPTAGRFLVGGRSAVEVEKDMAQIVDRYAIVTAPLAEAGKDSGG